MARITLEQAAAWGEQSKMASALTTLNTDLLDQIEAELLGRISGAGLNVGTWTNVATTPSIVQTIIAKKYVSWLIDRQYSTDVELSQYAARLDTNAEMLLQGILAGAIELPDQSTFTGQPSFYPNDASSSQSPTYDDPSLGGPAFSMGQTF